MNWPTCPHCHLATQLCDCHKRVEVETPKPQVEATCKQLDAALEEAQKGIAFAISEVRLAKSNFPNRNPFVSQKHVRHAESELEKVAKKLRQRKCESLISTATQASTALSKPKSDSLAAQENAEWAKEAAEKIFEINNSDNWDRNFNRTVELIIQSAIDKATASLRARNDELERRVKEFGGTQSRG